MNTLEEKFKQLVNRLKKIAKKNGDEFTCGLTLSMRGTTHQWEFECKETADNHCFVYGMGETAEDALIETEKSIPEVLQMWDYQE